MEGSRNNNFSNRFKNKTHVVGKEGLSSLLKEGDSVVPSRGSYPKIQNKNKKQEKENKQYFPEKISYKKINKGTTGNIQKNKIQRNRNKNLQILEPIKEKSSGNSYYQIKTAQPSTIINETSLRYDVETNKGDYFENLLKESNVQDFFKEMSDFSQHVKNRKGKKDKKSIPSQSFFR